MQLSTYSLVWLRLKLNCFCSIFIIFILVSVLVFSGINILILAKFSLCSNLDIFVQGIGVSIRIDSMLLNCSSEHTLETALNRLFVDNISSSISLSIT